MTRWFPARSALRAIAGRAEQAPMFMAAAKVPVGFARTMMPRSTLDQGLVMGLSMANDYALGALVQDGIEVAALRLLGRSPSAQADDLRWRRLTLRLDLAAVAIGAAMQRVAGQRPCERLQRATLRTAGYWMASTGFSGATIVALQDALRAVDRWGRLGQDCRSLPVALPAAGILAGWYEFGRRRRHVAETDDDETWRVAYVRSLGLGAAVMLAIGGLAAAERAAATALGLRLGRVLPGRDRLWRPLGHAGLLSLAAVALLAVAGRTTRRIETAAGLMEPAFDVPPASPLASGGPGSHVRFETLGRQGRRYVSTVLQPEWIAAVMGEPSAVAPIRVYVGLDSAASEAASVRRAIDELHRTGAFDRELLMVISPTGTGYVNYVAVESAEYLARGNIASVAIQYSKRPSVLSLDRKDEGSRQFRMLLEGIHDHVLERPRDRRPRVVLFGESLGAWTIQDAFLGTGTKGPLDLGVDRALWIGTPFRSKWKEQVLYADGLPVDRSLIGVFGGRGKVEALDPAERRRLRFFMVTHDNDAVAHFGIDLLVQCPPWLAPAMVDAPQQWVTPQTFMQTLIDMKNASKVIPGEFVAKGHDYRADLLHFVGEAYGLPCSEPQLVRIEDALRRYELLRKRWIDGYDDPPVVVPS